jgi:hypothetical protein
MHCYLRDTYESAGREGSQQNNRKQLRSESGNQRKPWHGQKRPLQYAAESAEDLAWETELRQDADAVFGMFGMNP